MTRASSGDGRSPTTGEHERRLAIGTIGLQAAQVIAVLAALTVTTLLGRRLSLSAFGTYGLIIGLAQVFAFAYMSVDGAAVARLSRASGDSAARDVVFRISVTAFFAWGVLGGLAIAALAGLFAQPLGVPDELLSDARLGGALVGAAIAVGWPLSATRGVLRAEQLFRRAAVADGLGYALMALATVVLVVIDAPLWALIGTGGAVPLLQGVAGLALCVEARVLPRWAPRVTASEVRDFMGFSLRLLATAVTDLVIYSLDRIVLAAFTSVRQVALYEGPARVHQFVRVTTGSLALTVLPSATRYRVEGDSVRTHDLLVRGTRYVLALVVPLVVVVCALAQPLLGAWLGARYEPAAWALAILVVHWLFSGNTVVAGGMLVAHERVGWLARYAWTVAAANLLTSIALTAAFGLEGVVLGTTIPYAIATPVFLLSAVRFLAVPLSDLARDAWLPAYSTGVALALALLGVRLAVDVEGLGLVVAVGVSGLMAYWGAYAVVWLRPAERRLVIDVARGMLRP